MITFPPLRQDIAVVVAEDVEAAALVDAGARGRGTRVARGARLRRLPRRRRSATGRKSVAIHLSLQAPDRTLSDDDAAVVRGRIVAALVERFDAELATVDETDRRRRCVAPGR